MKFTKDPSEQTTAATDIIITIVTSIGIVLIRWSEVNNSELWKINIWSAALGLIGLAAALGFVAHGLVLSPRIHRLVWQVLNLALGLAVSLFVVAVTYDLWGTAASLRALPMMLLAGLGFFLATLLYPGIFFLFIAFELLSLLFALVAYLILTVQGELKGAGLMAAGVLLSIIAAGIQTNKSVGVNIIWHFDHNGIYHIMQSIGLFFLIAGIRCSIV